MFHRFVLVLALCPSLIKAQVEVVLEVNNTASDVDDYFCWSPVPGRVRLVTGQGAAVEVVISSESTTDGGLAVFASSPGFAVSAQNFAPTPELNLLLPSDGSWVPFLVSGQRPSTDGKDASITAVNRADGVTLGQIDVMVRVRKNAENLTTLERDRFLEALARLHGHRRGVGPSDTYEKYADAHEQAFELGIHGGRDGFPLFLPWHRAFLLSLERQIQEIDPRVTIPYWRFDQRSRRIFIEDFMGEVSAGNQALDYIVRFSANNPLSGWRMATGALLKRSSNPATPLQDVYSSLYFETLSNLFMNPAAQVYAGQDPSQGVNAQIEERHHNFAHVAVGGGLNRSTSPRDPLFFLLHANVDRAWAKWQDKFGRFDASSVSSYSPQGDYPGKDVQSRLPKGSYAQDPMWPWSRDDGTETPEDDRDHWPNWGFDMPVSPAGYAPSGAPTPANMIDYLGKEHALDSHGVCYDDLGY